MVVRCEFCVVSWVVFVCRLVVAHPRSLPTPLLYASFRGAQARQLAFRWRPIETPTSSWDRQVWESGISFFVDDRIRLANYTRALEALERGAFAVACSCDEAELAALFVLRSPTPTRESALVDTVLWSPRMHSDTRRDTALRNLCTWHRATMGCDLRV